MAKANGNPGVETRGVGGSKRQGGRADTRWNRACRDAKRRAELHSTQSARADFQSPERGFVYIMRDARGAIKVGHTYDLPVRIRDMQYWVGRDRRPVVLVRAVEVPRSAMKRIEFRAFRLMKACRISEVHEWFATTASVASRRLNEAMRQISDRYPYLMEW